jgi:hypothetical protein
MKVEKMILKQEVTKVVEVPEYVLHLSEEEAETVRLVVGYVAGPMAGRRGHAHALYKALEKLGVNERNVGQC